MIMNRTPRSDSFLKGVHMAQIAVSALTQEQIRNKAPSVFAEQTSGKTSSRYAFVPTTQVITDLG